MKINTCWELLPSPDAIPFLEAVDAILPHRSVLAFELSKRYERPVDFYLRFPPFERIRKWHDTIAPESNVCHVGWCPEFKREFLKRLKRASVERYLWHIKAYKDGRLICWFHDASSGGTPVISPAVPRAKVKELARLLNCRYRLIKSGRVFWIRGALLYLPRCLREY